GGSVFKNGVYTTVTQSLKENGIKFHLVSGVRANPEFGKVCQAITEAKEHGCNGVLAVGGGSVLDSCKAVAAGMCLDKAEDVWQCYEFKHIVTEALPLFCVLTISATGSEVNGGTVLQRDDLRKKFSFKSPHLYPVCSCLDPEVQAGLPWYQTTNGLVDAITHTMEFLMTCSDPKEYEAGVNMGVGIIRTVLTCGDTLQRDEKDYAARANFMWAASCALSGIAAIRTGGLGDWAVHSLEHTLSAVHPTVSHGAGLGVLMPSYIQHHAQKGDRTALWERLAKDLFGGETWQDLVAGLKDMLKRWGHPTTLSALLDREIVEADIAQLTETFMMRPFSGYREDKVLPKDEAEAIYRLCCKE
ncbi:hypothetical protein KIPB_009513, partial [Kipferlia bialata]